ncbi:MAG: hypothetical protein QNJ38_01370 [Prochloraceae cyanobacterium]|nr:hypothetical protein [Prochloraceae cyanobacterium]
MLSATITYVPKIALNSGISIDSERNKQPIIVFYIPPPYPQILKANNVYGTVRITRTFQGHPTASFQFTASRDREVEIRNTFKDAEIFLWGMKFFVSNIQIERYSLLSNPGNLIEIILSLTGIHASRSQPSRSLADTPIKLGDLGQSATEVSINVLANKSNVSYRGVDIKIDIPKETSTGEIVEFRQELEGRAYIYNHFVYYSDPDFILTKQWGKTTIHTLAEAEIVSEKYSLSTPGKGTPITDGTVCLVKEYRNTIFNLDRGNIDKYRSEGNGASLDEIIREEFENTTAEDTLEDIQTPPTDGDFEATTAALRDPSSTFDNGGVVKKYRRITERNGIETERIERVYGWVFNSKDTYEVIIEDGEVVGTRFKDGVTSSALGFWQKVEDTTTTHIFDSDGYLIRTLKTGTKKGRVRQESNTLETIDLDKQIRQLQDDPTADPDLADETIASLVAEQSLYDYNVDFPIQDDTNYTLSNFREFYQDTRIPDVGETDFVEPKFTSLVSRKNLSVISKPDPSSTDDDRKPEVTTRESLTSYNRTVIVAPDPRNRQLKKPERYKTIEYQQAASGERGKYSTAAGKSITKKGRPPIHTRLKYPPGIVGIVTVSSGLTPPDDLEESGDMKYYLETPTASFLPTSATINPGTVKDFSLSNFSNLSSLQSLPVQQNSESFPGVDNAETARIAAQTKISIENTKSAEVVELSILRRIEFNEGDLVSWDGKVWVILEISETQIILPVEGILRMYYTDFKVKMGRLLNVPVDIKKYKIPDDSQDAKDLSDRLVVVSKN